MNKQIYLDSCLVWLFYFGLAGVILTALLLGYGAYWLFSHLVLTIV